MDPTPHCGFVVQCSLCLRPVGWDLAQARKWRRGRGRTEGWVGGRHRLPGGRLPGGGGWFKLGLEVLPAGMGLFVVSPVLLTPAGIASSRQAPCVWRRPRWVTVVPTDA